MTTPYAVLPIFVPQMIRNLLMQWKEWSDLTEKRRIENEFRPDFPKERLGIFLCPVVPFLNELAAKNGAVYAELVSLVLDFPDYVVPYLKQKWGPFPTTELEREEDILYIFAYAEANGFLVDEKSIMIRDLILREQRLCNEAVKFLKEHLADSSTDELVQFGLDHPYSLFQAFRELRVKTSLMDFLLDLRLAFFERYGIELPDVNKSDFFRESNNNLQSWTSSANRAGIKFAQSRLQRVHSLVSQAYS